MVVWTHLVLNKNILSKHISIINMFINLTYVVLNTLALLQCGE